MMSQKNFTFQTVLRPFESNKQWQESSAEMSLSFNCLPSGLTQKTCRFFSDKYIAFLVGGFNPFEKYDRQIGSFPQGSG